MPLDLQGQFPSMQSPLYIILLGDHKNLLYIQWTHRQPLLDIIKE